MSRRIYGFILSFILITTLCLVALPQDAEAAGIECNKTYYIRNGEGSVCLWNDDSCYPNVNAVNIELAGIYIYAPRGYYVYSCRLNDIDLMCYAQCTSTTTEITIPALTFSYYDSDFYPIHLVYGEEQNLDIVFAPICEDSDLIITYTAGVSELPSSLREEHSFLAEGGVHYVKGYTNEFAAETAAGWLAGTMKLIYPNGSSTEVYSGQRITPYQSCTIQIVYVLPITVSVNNYLSAEYGEPLPDGKDAFSFNTGYADAAGIDVTADVVYDSTDVGFHRVSLQNIKVYRNGKEFGSNELRLTVYSGGITITPAPLTITAASAEKVYDGKELCAQSFTADNLKNGDEITDIYCPNSITKVGSVDNVISSAVIENNGVNVSGNYSVTYINGTLSVTPAQLAIKARDNMQIYNGYAQTASDYSVAGSLADGDRLSVQSSGSATYVSDGKVISVPSSAAVYNCAGEDVSFCYNIDLDTETPGSISIIKQPVTVIANSFSAVYTGETISAEGCGAYICEDTPLADTDSLVSADTHGSLRFIGEGTVLASNAGIFAGDRDVTENYSITYNPGKLTLIPDETKGSVEIWLGGSKVYDGTVLENAFSYSVSGPGSEEIAGVAVAGTTIGPNVMSRDFSPENAEIKLLNNDGDILPNTDYNIIVNSGTVSITKQSIRIHPLDAVKEYSGSPYVGSINLEGTLSSGKRVFVTASTYTFIGDSRVSGTAVGKYTLRVDSATVKLRDEAGNDIASNFNIVCEDASLEVTADISAANYSKSSGGTVTISCSVSPNELAAVYIDGVALKKGADYSVATGSATLVTVVNAYLKELEVGNHTLSLSYENAGTLTTTISVSSSGKTSSSTLASIFKR